MVQLDVGDRFRFIRNNSNGGERYGRIGEIGIVDRIYGRNAAAFKFEDEVRQRQLGFPPGFEFEDVELVDAAAPQKIDKVYYSLVYKPRYGSQRMMGFSTEREATEKKAQIEAAGGKVFGMKKLTLKLDAQEGL